MEKYGVWNVSSAGWCFLAPKCPKEKSVHGLFGTRKEAEAELRSYQKEYCDNKYVIALHSDYCNGDSIIVANCCEPVFVDQK
jgi:hypothetical protein